MSACKPAAILTAFILLTTGPEFRPNFKSRSFDRFSRQSLRHTMVWDFTSRAKSFDHLAGAFTLLFHRAVKERRLSSPCQKIRVVSHHRSPILRRSLRRRLRPKENAGCCVLDQ